MSRSTALRVRRMRVCPHRYIWLLACLVPRAYLSNMYRIAGGKFKLELFLTEDYPMVPPKIRFLTKIYHPNVDRLGRICLDVLKSKNHICLCPAVSSLSRLLTTSRVFR